MNGWIKIGSPNNNNRYHLYTTTTLLAIHEGISLTRPYARTRRRRFGLKDRVVRVERTPVFVHVTGMQSKPCSKAVPTLAVGRVDLDPSNNSYTPIAQCIKGKRWIAKKCRKQDWRIFCRTSGEFLLIFHDLDVKIIFQLPKTVKKDIDIG